MINLCCAKEVWEAFIGDAKMWQGANGTLPYEKAKKEVNLYTTTLHVLNSCIVKMGKLTEATTLYRGMSGRLFLDTPIAPYARPYGSSRPYLPHMAGMSGRVFPDKFWTKNPYGVKGGVEFAFMSCTPKRSVAEQ